MNIRKLPGIALSMILVLGGACVTSRTNNTQAPAAPQLPAPRVTAPADYDEAAKMRRKLVESQERAERAERELVAAKAAANQMPPVRQALSAQPAPAKPSDTYNARHDARVEYSKEQQRLERNNKIDSRLRDENCALMMALMRSAGLKQGRSTVTRTDDNKIVWHDWNWIYDDWTLNVSITESGGCIAYGFYETPEPGTADAEIIAALLKCGNDPTPAQTVAYSYHKVVKMDVEPSEATKTFECIIRKAIDSFKSAANTKK